MNEGFQILTCASCGAKNRISADHLNRRAFCGKCHKPLLQSDHPIDLNDHNFQEEVLQFSGPVLAIFWVPWCGACKILMPTLDILARDYAGKVKVAKINIEQNPMLSSYYKIDATPTLNFYKKGQLLRSIKGALPANELKQQMDYFLS